MEEEELLRKGARISAQGILVAVERRENND